MATPFSAALDNGPAPTSATVVVKGSPVVAASSSTTYKGPAVPSSGAAATAVPGIPLLAGFELWIPPRPAKYQDGLPVYEILGTDAQIVQFPLRAGRQIMCFSGAMCYMSVGMKMEAK